MVKQPTSEIASIEIGDTRYILPSELIHIAKAINESEYIKSLEDDWDTEAALKVPVNVYYTAIEILYNYSTQLLKNYGIAIKAPEINPGRDGSVDLDWRCKNAELLISVQNTNEFLAHFYGDDGNNNTEIKGYLNSIEVDQDLLFWMRKLK